MLDYKPNIVLSNKDYRVVGTRPIRHDGTDKVTGRARYGADINMPGLLYGKVLRSPHAHARIKSIDTSRALALPGVKAVVTGSDFPQPSGRVTDLTEGAMHNPKFLSNNCMAADKALYKGHAVAALAATSPHIAEEALSLIWVDYEVLPPVLDGRHAMEKDAPILLEGLVTLSNPNMGAGGIRSEADDGKGSNISNHFEFRLGDVEKGFKEADVIIEREYHTSPVHQGYIEPHSATAMWHTDGNVTIWSSSQGQFAVRDMTAMIVGVPVSRVKAIPMEIGGGFGGKTLVYLEPVAAALSRKTGQPVKVSMSRAEVFEGTGPTSGTHIKVKIGAKRDGHITAAAASLIYEAGAYPGSPVRAAVQCIFAPYNMPNTYIEGYDVVVNKPKSAAYRAPGSPAAAFAMESTIDEVCEKLGMDPIEFRLLNGAKEGTRRATGPVFGRIGYLETLEAAKGHPHYSAPLEGPNRGRGVASGFWFNGTGPSSAIASVNPDGTVSLVEGSPDIGGTRVAVAQQLAEVLGIPVENVKPSVADTDSIGYTSTTGGSGVAFKTGWACYEAAQDVKRQMIERAAKIWQIPVENVEYAIGVLQHKSDPELKLTFRQLAARLNATGGPIVGRATVDPRGVGNAFATHIVDVQVDPETGKVDILRYTAIQDAGKAVHPSYVEGQIQGGVVQGIGWALNEEYYFNDQGQMMNSSFLDYRMPTSLDLPMIDTVIVEVANPGHPYGVRGVGEVPICPPMAAIANAIHRAIGVRMDQLPMSPGRILDALWEKNGK
jgi:CO/xanthine dehydrogenase Mo-binding subunit